MRKIKAKLAEWSKNRGLVKAGAIIAGIVAVLLICLCISICMQTNMQKKYSSCIHQMHAQQYRHLSAMTELFEEMNEPEADVRNALLPELKAQYTAAAAINSVLIESAPKHALLTGDQISAFYAAFEQYISAYRQGSATGLARADMAACMEDVQAMVDAHDNPPVPEDEQVVIINASSGKIEK